MRHQRYPALSKVYGRVGVLLSCWPPTPELLLLTFLYAYSFSSSPRRIYGSNRMQGERVAACD